MKTVLWGGGGPIGNLTLKRMSPIFNMNVGNIEDYSMT